MIKGIMKVLFWGTVGITTGVGLIGLWAALEDGDYPLE